MNIRYRVELSEAERGALQALLGGGKRAARKLKRAQILLAADAGVPDETIATSLAVGGSTVYRTKRRFVEDSLERALDEGWSGRSTKGRARAPLASSRARRRPCWWRPPARARPRVAPAGRWRCWPARWCG
jgi:hypothetical protein